MEGGMVAKRRQKKLQRLNRTTYALPRCGFLTVSIKALSGEAAIFAFLPN
jgi:hypothetical protein